MNCITIFISQQHICHNGRVQSHELVQIRNNNTMTNMTKELNEKKSIKQINLLFSVTFPFRGSI